MTPDDHQNWGPLWDVLLYPPSPPKDAAPIRLRCRLPLDEASALARREGADRWGAQSWLYLCVRSEG